MQAAANSEWPVVSAPTAWRCVDFISDLHLHAGTPATVAAWQQYLQHTRAQAVFILGDLFEAWVGDDVLGAVACGAADGSSFEDRCAHTLLQATQRLDVFFMCGNRDFLAGQTFARACNMRWLGDPALLDFAGQRWLLSHGDALCLADTDYQKFRALVRGPAWQQEFLAQPLAQRKALARSLRERSEAHKRTHPVLVDVDGPAAVAWLAAAHSKRLIHGHTHRPADHDLGSGMQRSVLSDWDLDAEPARAQVLRISADAPALVQRLALDAV